MQPYDTAWLANNCWWHLRRWSRTGYIPNKTQKGRRTSVSSMPLECHRNRHRIQSGQQYCLRGYIRTTTKGYSQATFGHIEDIVWTHQGYCVRCFWTWVPLKGQGDVGSDWWIRGILWHRPLGFDRLSWPWWQGFIWTQLPMMAVDSKLSDGICTCVYYPNYQMYKPSALHPWKCLTGPNSKRM